MNYGNTEDAAIESGDKGDLVPLHDTAMNAGDVLASAQQVEGSEGIGDGAESAVDTPVQTESVETVVEIPLSAHSNIWQRVREMLFGGSSGLTTRLNQLTQTIEDHPESYVNYLLRADVYMQMREFALAHADYQRAYDLAESQFELADWGLMEQAMRDRAFAGLEKAKRRLG